MKGSKPVIIYIRLFKCKYRIATMLSIFNKQLMLLKHNTVSLCHVINILLRMKVPHFCHSKLRVNITKQQQRPISVWYIYNHVTGQTRNFSSKESREKNIILHRKNLNTTLFNKTYTQNLLVNNSPPKFPPLTVLWDTWLCLDLNVHLLFSLSRPLRILLTDSDTLFANNHKLM